MQPPEVEQDLLKSLPTVGEVVRHLIALVAAACLLGPVAGPWLAGWINPAQVWGGGGVGDYSPMAVLQWGLAFLMFEAFFYTAWLVLRARKGRSARDADGWWNRQ